MNSARPPARPFSASRPSTPSARAVRVGLAAGSLLLALAACKNDPPKQEAEAKDAAAAPVARAGVVASCEMISAVGSCTEWAKLSMGLERGLCQGLKGSYVEGAGAGCTATNELGRCAMADGEVKHYYSAAAGPTGYTLADAERDCTSPELAGKFTKTSP